MNRLPLVPRQHASWTGRALGLFPWTRIARCCLRRRGAVGGQLVRDVAGRDQLRDKPHDFGHSLLGRSQWVLCAAQVLTKELRLIELKPVLGYELPYRSHVPTHTGALKVANVQRQEDAEPPRGTQGLP